MAIKIDRRSSDIPYDEHGFAMTELLPEIGRAHV